jgi:hypothetical protein
LAVETRRTTFDRLNLDQFEMTGTALFCPQGIASFTQNVVTANWPEAK